MTLRPSRTEVVAAAVLFSLLCAFVLHRWAPDPSADSARASEEAFAEGLEEREFVPPLMGPGRWTGAGATFRFRHVPPGPARLQVRVRAHQNPVRVLADRVALGMLTPRDRGADFDVVADGDVRVDLVVKPFLARGGRRLGTFLDRVALVHARSLLPSPTLIVLFVAVGLATSLGALAAGLGKAGALGAAALTSVVQALLLWPHGLVRSAYADRLTLMLVAGVGLLGLLARRRPWLFLALGSAFLVQGVAALHPLVIGLDASFHGHNLAEVLGGNYFLTSETQHKPPFRFPYGISFYLPLVPFVRHGADLVPLVRLAASVAGIAGSAAIFWGLVRSGRTPRFAAGTVVLLQLVPWSFDVYSNGNYSNVFAQAALVAFFAWWIAGKPFGWPAGAAAFVVASLAHLSGFLVLLALGAALVLVHRRDPASQRAGLVALAVGVAGALLYYSQFVPLALEQLPRFLEGERGGTGASTMLASLGAQVRGALSGWGAPAIALALLGRARDPDRRAFWLAGAALAVAAVTTPVEVRYLYALTLPLAIAAANGIDRLAGGRLAARLVAAALVAALTLLGVRNVALAMLHDWRA